MCVCVFFVGLSFVLFWSDDECVNEKGKENFSLVVLPMATQTANVEEMMFALSVRKVIVNVGVSACKFYARFLCVYLYSLVILLRGHVRLIHCSLAERDIFRLASFERVRIKFS